MAEKKKGMSKAEVEKHLKGVKTTRHKISYLNDVLKKKRLLAESTQEAVYESLAGLYEKKGDYEHAGDIYGDKLNRQEVAAETYEKGKLFYGAGKVWEDIDKPEKAAEAYEKTPKWGLATHMWRRAGKPEEAGRVDEEHEMFDSAAKNYEEAGKFVKAAKMYREAGEPEKAREMWMKAGKPKQADKVKISQEEIEEQLKGKRTNESKKNYLLKVHNRQEKLLDKKTKTFVQGLIADFFLNDKKYEQAAGWFKAVGKHSEAAKYFEKVGRNVDAINEWDKAGEFEKAIKGLEVMIRLREGDGGPRAQDYLTRNLRPTLKRVKEKLERREKKEGKLESTVAGIIGLAGIGVSLFFLSGNITGNVIGNLTQSNSNELGACLLVIVALCSFVYFKKK